jgi:glyoxylase-like metal-dependent hydrolase (beta-lactamase superfamily II)
MVAVATGVTVDGDREVPGLELREGGVVEFEQFYLESLGHASYLVRSGQSGEALVVDPRRDVDVYVEAASERGLRIRYVVDTHQHNYYLAGLPELVARTGCEGAGQCGSRSWVTSTSRSRTARSWSWPRSGSRYAHPGALIHPGFGGDSVHWIPTGWLVSAC